MPGPTRTDPYRSYNFKLQVGDFTEGHFMECSGIEAEVAAIDYREAGDIQKVVHKLPGPVKYTDVTLKYGLTDSSTLFDWFMACVEGKVDRRNVSIFVMDNEGLKPVAQWDLTDAWPTYWKSTKLDALGREVAIETLRLTFEHFARAPVGGGGEGGEGGGA